jgi:phosphoribulokinase
MQALSSNMSARRSVGGARLQTRAPARAVARYAQPARAQGTVLIGLAADSGCGKSTFMRRMTNLFGGSAKPPAGGNPDSNTLISDITTVLCLDDYHLVRPGGACGRGGRRAGGMQQGAGQGRGVWQQR